MKKKTPWRGRVRQRVGRPRAVDVPFDPDKFEALQKDLIDGTIPLERIAISDDESVGLRAFVRPDSITYHSSYYVSDTSRRLLKLGDHPDMTLADARKLNDTIQGLSTIGIDPQEGLHERLIRELAQKGTRWRP